MVSKISGRRDGRLRSRSDRSAPEQNTLPVPVSTMALTVAVRGGVPESVRQLIEQLRRQRVAVGRRVERQGSDEIAVGDVDQLSCHECAV